MLYSEEQFKLIVEAIRHEYKNNPMSPEFPIIINGIAISATSVDTNNGVFILLDITKHKTLHKIPNQSTVSAINWLELMHKVLKNYSPRTSKYSKNPRIIPQSTQDDPLHYLIKVYDSFDNWYDGYLFKLGLRLEDLTQLNLEKIYNLVIDIDEAFQLKPEQQTVAIKVTSLNYDKFPKIRNKIIGNTQIRRDFRKDALDYLEDKNIIYHYSISPVNDDIEIALNIDAFKVFKKDIVEAYTKKIQHTSPEASSEKPATISKDAGDKDKEILYSVTFSYNNEILLNNIVLSKVNFDSENANVFEYLYHNPNRKITKKEFKEKAQYSVGKSFHKIVENWGFTGNMRKLFFSVSEQAILFKNPITREDLEKLKMPLLKLKRNSLE